VAARSDRPAFAPPVRLFSGAYDERPAPRANFDVAGDGRFLMLRVLEPAQPQTIVVLLNWQ
jgi:hypothetical protein